MLSAEPKAETDNTYRVLDYSGYHRNGILKEINSQLDIALSNHATHSLVKKIVHQEVIQQDTNFIDVCRRSSDTYQL